MQRPKRRVPPCRLDATAFSISVHTSAAPRHGSGDALFRIIVMKQSLIFLALVSLASTGFSQQPTQLKDEKDKVSYSIGLDIGNTFKKQKMDINTEVLMAGIKDAQSGAKPLLSEEQVKETMTAFSKSMVEIQTAAAKEAAEKNAAEGEKFLAENKAKEGVKTTPSGLQYKVLREGSGTSPKETDTVVTQYRGTLINGTEFDSSYKRNEPTTFPVNRVIKGWTEALQMMKPGAKYQLFIPANLAYGERGAGQDIGPNETLIFEIELLSVKPSEPKPDGTPVPALEAKPDAKASPKPEAKTEAKPDKK
jgi:FKBP-type peptidyl-prolyl cis-trans isomerase FklB